MFSNPLAVESFPDGHPEKSEHAPMFAAKERGRQYQQREMTAVGFEPTPFRNGALSHRLRPLGQTVLTSLFRLCDTMAFKVRSRGRPNLTHT